MTVLLKIIFITLILNFLLPSDAFLIDQTVINVSDQKSSEDKGKGMTDQQVNFLKSKIIEVAKIMGSKPQDNADQLIPILTSGLQGVWGVFIISSAKADQCNLGLRVGDPLDDKWWQGDQYGPYSWTYIIWKQRN